MARAPAACAAAVLALVGCGADPAADPRPQRSSEPVPSASGPASPGRQATVPSPTVSERSLTQEEQVELNEALVAAAWADDVDRAAGLVRRGADVDWRDDTRQSAFLIAASEGHLELLELTLRHGADVDLHDSFDGTALIRAAERGHRDVVGRLLQTPISVDHVNNLGWVALHEAIILGDGSPDYVDTVRALVAGGASLGIPSRDDGVVPLDHARSREQTDVVTTLERALGTGRVDRPDEALLAAAGRGDADGVAIALRAGADLEARDDAGRTALLVAVTEDHVRVAGLLLALGASPDALDDRHDSPWLVTGVTGSVPMADLLLRFHPDLTIRNRFGGLSIIPASERGHVGYVRRVARTPIDLDHVNDLGWTALLEAVVLGDGSRPYVAIVRLLLAHGADAGIPDRHGVTALEHARARGLTRVARVLARRG